MSEKEEVIKYVKGPVEFIVQNNAALWGVRILGEWYNGTGPAPKVEKGQEVQGNYIEKNKKKYILNLIDSKTKFRLYTAPDELFDEAFNSELKEEQKETATEQYKKTQTINLQGKKVTITITVE